MNVVTFLWGDRYKAEHVNRLARQVARHYARPHRFLCVTNQTARVECETVPDLEDFAAVRSLHGPAFPSCYRRLRLFHPDAAQSFGERFVAVDLDAVILGDLAPLWDRPDDFVAWRDPFYGHRGQICGSMMLLRAGARPRVWTDFDPSASPIAAWRAGFRGSDQAWISLATRGEVATWTRDDGVYSYRGDLRSGVRPADARIVMFHGNPKPWDWTAPAWARAAS